ncbi:MAG TPA: PilN domain-containing protein [Gaiellaceae bacterium]
MRAVNLLPKDDAGQSRKGPPLPVIVGCIGLVLLSALLAVMYLSASGKVANEKKALQQAQTQYASIPTPPAPPAVVTSLPQEEQSRVTALAGALGQRVAWDRVLREVSQVLPSDVWLVTLDAQSPSFAPASTAPASTGVATTLPTGFVVTGCTYSQDSVARFLARLDLVPDLSGMTLGRSQSGGSASGAGASGCPAAMFTFTLQGTVRPSGATS